MLVKAPNYENKIGKVQKLLQCQRLLLRIYILTFQPIPGTFLDVLQQGYMVTGTYILIYCYYEFMLFSNEKFKKPPFYKTDY